MVLVEIVENIKKIITGRISIEIIDLQCLMPFDIKEIKESIRKRNDFNCR